MNQWVLLFGGHTSEKIGVYITHLVQANSVHPWLKNIPKTTITYNNYGGVRKITLALAQTTASVLVYAYCPSSNTCWDVLPSSVFRKRVKVPESWIRYIREASLTISLASWNRYSSDPLCSREKREQSREEHHVRCQFSFHGLALKPFWQECPLHKWRHPLSWSEVCRLSPTFVRLSPQVSSLVFVSIWVQLERQRSRALYFRSFQQVARDYVWEKRCCPSRRTSTPYASVWFMEERNKTVGLTEASKEVV